MRQVLRYLKKYVPWMLLIVALLIAQAFCDLALPTYTSKLVDTGITTSGVTDTVPKIMSQQTYQSIQFFMTDNEKVTLAQYYVQTADLSDAGYPVKTETAGAQYYYLTDEDYPQALSDAVQIPLLIVYQSAHPDANASAPQEDMSKKTPQEIRQYVKDSFGDKLENYADTVYATINAADYETLGIDIDAVQKQYLFITGAKMLAMALAMMAITIVVGLIAAKVSAKIGMQLRGAIFKRVVSFSNNEMDKFSTASLITRSTNDIQQVQLIIVLLLRMVAYAPILGIGGMLKVLATNSSMTWIIGIAVGAVLVIVGVLIKIAMPKFKAMQSLVDRVNLVMREILTGLTVIRAFGRGKFEEKRFDKANNDLTDVSLFTNRVMTFMFPLMMLIMNGTVLLVVWVGGHKIDAGTLQVGQMMAFIQYSMMIVMSFLMLTMISVMLPRSVVSANRIAEVLDTAPEILDRPNAVSTGITKGLVKFDNVSFRYPNASEDVLRNISFTAEPGKTTAIIGSTGCGKSTLAHLILRFYDVTEGKITIDGTDIRDRTQASLRESIGFVPQKATLFSGTIGSNLRFGGEDAPEEWIEKSAEIAQASEFISAKPEGFESEIAQGGTNVSGGQKQRLSIARAIAKKPPVYIFDDSFSALDYKTDVALRKALGENVGASTVLIVAQRIVTILNADRIIVLDDGEIKGIGTHMELLDSCEVYQQIVRSQLSEDEIAKFKKSAEKEESNHA
ncbi:MAG: ABC transporter ATP-binding protein [Oscillospiraceae bacterium]